MQNSPYQLQNFSYRSDYRGVKLYIFPLILAILYFHFWIPYWPLLVIILIPIFVWKRHTKFSKKSHNKSNVNSTSSDLNSNPQLKTTLCEKCGSSLQNNDLFCSECGSKIY